MFNIFKDFCVFMGFVINDHPWRIDCIARYEVKRLKDFIENQKISRSIELKVSKRVQELEKDEVNETD